MRSRRTSLGNLLSGEISAKKGWLQNLWSDNYEGKLCRVEIITGNYHRKLSASIYHHAKNVGIIGILAYPKTNATFLGHPDWNKLVVQLVHILLSLWEKFNFWTCEASQTEYGMIWNIHYSLVGLYIKACVIIY